MDMTDRETASIDKTFILCAALACLLILFGFVIDSSLEKEEKRDCLNLKKQAQVLRADLLLPSPEQKKQCYALGVEISASSKGGG